MEYRKLGSSGLQVSAFALGSWMTYEFMAEDEALNVFKSGLDQGINFLDDARYDDRTGKAPLKSGYSEVLFGQLLRKSGANRHDLIIGNKLWLEFYPGQSLEEEIDGSLGRMQMDYLDLAYCATPPASVPLVDLLRQLNALIKTGKLRYWGVLNWPAELLVQAHELATREGLQTPVASQPAYSLLVKTPVEDPQTAHVYREGGIGIVASFTLYGGLLTGKYNRDAGALDSRFKPEDIENMREKGLLEKVDRIIEIAESLGCTPAQLAMAYVLKNPQVASILFGAKQPGQIKDNLKALEVATRLDDTIMANLRAL
jgi:aryl-alcohol dehydrogenase-like predicted oxidoreductase